jgi:hypothetical protein
MIDISPLGFQMLTLQMHLDQLEKCRAAIAGGQETITLLDGVERDAVITLRETIGSMVSVVAEVDAIAHGLLTAR